MLDKKNNLESKNKVYDMSSENGSIAFHKLLGGMFLVIAGGYLLLHTFYDWGGGIMIACGVICIFDI